ncbi:PD-(D/E)XK nuclease domain-containing protein [Christensenella intestinihominis]|uniref:PD-(D/E)XK nuclease domain-containing protein n=1 Tax=Christensenella intestinihominis TaxID=1851429 RepID=UPI0008327783|nr:hypothetical protein [Christensenella intestinihominis]
MGKQSLDETRELKVLLHQVKAFIDTMQGVLNNKEMAEHSRYVAYKDMACIYNDFAEKVRQKTKVASMFYTFKTDEMKGYMDTLWGEQKRIFEQVLIAAKMLYATLEGTLDFVDDEFDNLESFFGSRLRAAVHNKPEKEMEIQDVIEVLLLGRGLGKGTDYDRETGKFKFSGKEYIPDFIIPKLQLCIEVKLLRDGKKSKIIEEINADITAYSKQYERQLFIVYDLGCIQNEEEFKRDIESMGNIKVLIIKH